MDYKSVQFAIAIYGKNFSLRWQHYFAAVWPIKPFLNIRDFPPLPAVAVPSAAAFLFVLQTPEHHVPYPSTVSSFQSLYPGSKKGQSVSPIIRQRKRRHSRSVLQSISLPLPQTYMRKFLRDVPPYAAVHSADPPAYNIQPPSWRRNHLYS